MSIANWKKVFKKSRYLLKKSKKKEQLSKPTKTNWNNGRKWNTNWKFWLPYELRQQLHRGFQNGL
jgi:hypothetical protein